MEYTPEPWETRKADITNPDSDIGIVGDGMLLAEVFEHAGPTYEVIAPVEANARLIAAAPDYDDLLERFTSYVQTKLLANIRSIEGGQSVIDGAWALVSEAHGLLKRVKATEPS